MYQNQLNRQWTPCKICKWGSGRTTQEEYNEHCDKCNSLASEWEESNEFKQFKIGVELSKIAEKIQEAQEKLRVYPVLILCRGAVKNKFKEINKEEAYKKGLDIIFIDSIYELEHYASKWYSPYAPRPIFIADDSIEIRDYVYMNPAIMGEWKVFTCFPNFNTDIDKDITSKNILDLKLDKRFDQLTINSYPAFKTDLSKLYIMPEILS